MKSVKSWTLIFASAALTFASASQAGHVSIDTFDDGQPKLTAGPSTTVSGSTNGLGILGIERELSLTNKGTSIFSEATFQIPGIGLAAESNAVLTTSKAVLTYDGVLSLGLGSGSGVDLIDGTNDRIRFGTTTITGGDVTFTVKITDTDTDMASASVVASAGGPADHDIFFSDLGGVDLDKVESIEVTIETFDPGITILFSEITATVPEPSTFLLVGLGLAAPALIVARQRKKA